MANPINYKPLLPKTTQDFSGGNAPGQWMTQGHAFFNQIATSLDFEAGNYGEVNSIPSPWSRALQFISAMRNPRYPSRAWLLAQYRGFLATLALAENLKLEIQATQINIPDYQTTEFGRCLWKLRPGDQDNVLPPQPGSSIWSQFYLLELDNHPLGFTSPATLVVPGGHLHPSLNQRIAWVKDGFFVDPIGNGITPQQKSLLAPWLQNLRAELFRNPQNEELAGAIAGQLDLFYQALGIPNAQIFEKTERPIPFGSALTPAPLTALYPAKVVTQASNVQVQPSVGLTPFKKLHIIDQQKVSALAGRDAKEINVIDSSSLDGFDRNLHQRSDALFLHDHELFSEQLFYSKNKDLLPGTWLDRKLNLEKLTIFLPLNPVLKDYFTSTDLERQVNFTAVSTAEGQGIRVSLQLILSGFGSQKINYSTHKDFPLKAENEITKAFPTVALWPNVPPGKWQEYFVLVETTESYDLAFGIEQPTDRASQEIRRSGQESYQYWKCERYPELLLIVDNNARYLGLLPLTVPKSLPGGASTWTVGVDFGTSFTNVYVRKGGGTPEHLALKTHLLKVTAGLGDIDAKKYREFFVPEFLIPKDKNPPLATVLTTQGWQEVASQVPNIINQTRIYVPRLDTLDFGRDHIKTNIKWHNIQYQRPFLGQLLRMIAAQAAQDEVHTIEWAVSYPSAFSRQETNKYTTTWAKLLHDLNDISGQIHRQSTTYPLRTESIAFAQFFADIQRKDLIHATCIDIGGGTSDISVWQENKLIHQASVPYAGRDMFHRILQPGLAFIGEIFGLSVNDAESVRKELASYHNFNSALDHYLRGNAERILSDGYVINSDKPRNREFRTLLALALGGLFHYIGLIQKYLGSSERMLNQEIVTSILIGGNGSRFVHWLTTSGGYTSNSEVNLLVKGILSKTTELNPNPTPLTISSAPKEEACGGLTVSSHGQRLKGLEQANEAPFLGESCTINGQLFTAEQHLDIPDDYVNIDDFRITSFDELERYIINFNTVIADEHIEEIDPLRNFSHGGIFSMTDDQRQLLKIAVTNACLRKCGSANDFEPEPPFLLTLRCFIGVLADQWSQTAG